MVARVVWCARRGRADRSLPRRRRRGADVQRRRGEPRFGSWIARRRPRARSRRRRSDAARALSRALHPQTKRSGAQVEYLNGGVMVGFKRPGEGGGAVQGAFDIEAFQRAWSQAIEQARTPAGQIDGTKLAASPVLDELVKAPRDRALTLVLGPLIGAAGADTDQVLGKLISARRGGQPLEEISLNVYDALAQLVRAPVSGANDVSRIEMVPLLDAGKTTVSFAPRDITEITGVDISIVPGHTTADFEKGGGGRGGIEKAWWEHGMALNKIGR